VIICNGFSSSLVETIKEGNKDQEMVTMTKFDNVTKWFGPFFMAEPGPAIINEVKILSNQPYASSSFLSSYLLSNKYF
jgi:hypothetical protein